MMEGKLEDELEDYEKRIADILLPGQTVEELPQVSVAMLQKYYDYLSQKLPRGLRLTGQETMGYFAWEERFDFGYGSKKEYKQLKKQIASCYDKFKLFRLKNIDPSLGIIAQVSRIRDSRIFYIPLADLEACDEDSPEYTLIDDYSIWFVNYNEEWD